MLALFTSPLARGLFHKGIVQSPYGVPSHTRAKARKTGIQVASAVGLLGAGATAVQLRAVPAESFAQLEGAGLSLAPGFVTGDAAFPQTILRAFQKGEQARLPLIIGSNSDEASVALAFGIEPVAVVRRLGAARILVKSLYPQVRDDTQLGREVVRDLVFTTFARRIAYLHSAKVPTWRYYFNHVQVNLRGQETGVPHGGEIAAVFGTGDQCQCLETPLTDADRAMSQRVGDYWFEFVRSGTPEPIGELPWPKDDRKNSNTMEFSDTVTVKTDFMKVRLKFFIGTLNLIGRFLDRE